MRILVIHDEITSGMVLRDILTEAALKHHLSWEMSYHSFTENLLDYREVEALVFDLWHMDHAILEEIHHIRSLQPYVPIVIVSIESYTSTESVFRWDHSTVFLGRTEMSWIPIRIHQLIKRQHAHSAWRQERQFFFENAAIIARASASPPIVAISDEMRTAIAILDAALDGERPIVLVGEPGSGRRTVARSLIAQRAVEWVEWDFRGCSQFIVQAQVEPLIHSNAVGRVLVSNFDQLSSSVQDYLWQVLMPRKRVPFLFPVITTSRVPRWDTNDLSEQMRIPLPALRDRPEDILVLARYFLVGYGIAIDDLTEVLSDRLRSFLLTHYYTANVRELASLMAEQAQRFHSSRGLVNNVTVNAHQ